MDIPFLNDVSLGWRECADIGLVTGLLWACLSGIRRAPARLALGGFLLLFLAWIAAVRLELPLTRGLLQSLTLLLAISFVVVFQEDVRQLFEQLAVQFKRKPSVPPENQLDALVNAVARLATQHVGALIVLPGRAPLERHVTEGIDCRAQFSEALLLSLFDPNSPGHDGAVVLEGSLVARFAVHLPLSDSPDAHEGEGGTRHAAALGLSELTDATCIVVSEEQGTISLAHEGRLERLGRPEQALEVLRERLGSSSPEGPTRRRLAAHGLALAAEGLTALLLASTIWLLLVPGAAVITRARTARVIVNELPEAWSMTAMAPAEVEVQLRGRRRDFLTLPATLDLRATAPPADLLALGRRTVTLSQDDVDGVDNLEVQRIIPGVVRLTLERRPAPAKPD